MRRRQINIVDRWADSRYSRILVFANQAVEATIAQQASGGEPGLTVTLRSGLAITEKTKADAQALVIKMLGLPIDLRAFYLLVKKSSILNPVVEQFIGVRPPRFPSIVEALVNAIACQQVSLESGLTTLNRFSREAQNNLQRLFCLEAKPGYDEIKELVAQWVPYQGFVYFNLLLEKLRQKGFV